MMRSNLFIKTLFTQSMFCNIYTKENCITNRVYVCFGVQISIELMSSCKYTYTYVVRTIYRKFDEQNDEIYHKMYVRICCFIFVTMKMRLSEGEI